MKELIEPYEAPNAAAFYATYYNNSDGLKTYNKNRIPYFKKILATAPCKNSDIILDAGCGPGGLLREIIERCPKATIHAIDIIPAVKPYIKKHFPQVTAKVGSIYSTDYKSGFFSLVYCVSSIEHVLYPKKAIEELERITMPNGKIVVVVPDGRFDTNGAHVHHWSKVSYQLFLCDSTANLQNIWIIEVNKKRYFVAIIVKDG